VNVVFWDRAPRPPHRLRRSSFLPDDLDAAAEVERTIRKVIVTLARAEVGYLPPHNLEDKTPRKRRRTTSDGPRSAA
jgi:hypothetical protein